MTQDSLSRTSTAPGSLMWQGCAGFLFLVAYALTEVTVLVLAYFAVVFAMELNGMRTGDREGLIQQGLMLVPLMGVSVVNGVPLGNVYIALLAVYLLFTLRREEMDKAKFAAFSAFMALDLIRIAVFSEYDLDAMGLLSIPVLYLCMFAGLFAFSGSSASVVMCRYAPAFVVGAAQSAVYGFLTRFMSGGIRYALVNSDVVTRCEGASGDPNYYGWYICLAVAMLLLFVVYGVGRPLPALVLAVVLLVLGLSSSSRMYYVLVCVLAFAAVFVLLGQLKRRRFLFAMFALCLVVVGCILARDAIVENVNYVLARTSTSSLNELTNGRSALASDYMAYIMQDPLRMLFGIGIAQYNVRSGIGAYAHNAYIEILVTTGVLGAACFLAVLVFTCVALLNRRLNTPVRFLPLLLFALGGAAINVLEVDSFYLLAGLLVSLAQLAPEGASALVTGAARSAGPTITPSSPAHGIRVMTSACRLPATRSVLQHVREEVCDDG